MVVDLNTVAKIYCEKVLFNNIIWKEWKDGKNLWCLSPYPDHPNGCPSYGSPHCPPNNICIKQKTENQRELYILYLVFDFKKYKELRKIEYPQWTEKQLGNSRHWQKALHKKMKDFILSKSPDFILSAGSGFLNSCSMEGAGINVFRTLENIGFKVITDATFNKKKDVYWSLIKEVKTIELKPKNKIVLCSLYGYSKDQISIDSFLLKK